MTVEQRLLAAVWAESIKKWGLWNATHYLMHWVERNLSRKDGPQFEELTALQDMLVAALEETSKDVAKVFE